MYIKVQKSLTYLFFIVVACKNVFYFKHENKCNVNTYMKQTFSCTVCIDLKKCKNMK